MGLNPSLLAVDWGTSSLRGALLDAQGGVLEAREFARGILSVAEGGFAAVFDECFGDWRAAHPDLPCLMAGMVGSRQGWQEAPYCACPAGFSELAERLSWIEPGRIAIVPGLSDMREGLQHDAALEKLPDVMRGEETQVFGALATLGRSDALLVLPGTHSKWVYVYDSRIVAFSTFMTGECYALLRQHSILARTMPQEDDSFDEAGFTRGVRVALLGRNLLQSAFTVRTLALFEQLPQQQRPSYLSGLLIGEELRAQNLHRGSEVVVIGNPALTRRYKLALALCEAQALCPGAQATWQGLHALARRAGLLRSG